METRRLLLFLVVSFGFVLIWTNFVVEKPQKPGPQPPAPVGQPAQLEPEPEPEPAADVASAEAPAEAVEQDSSGDQDSGEAADAELTAQVVHERRQVVLGSLDPQRDYAIQATFTSEGAAIIAVRLADPRMKDLTDRDEQVQVLGNGGRNFRTFSTSLHVIDQQLQQLSPGISLENTDWEVRSQETDSVVFAHAVPERHIEIQKTYRVQPLTAGTSDRSTAFRTDPGAYTIQCELVVRNLSSETQTLQYEILGPCGVVLENEEHTRKYRDIKMEFVEDGKSALSSAADVQSVWDEQRSRHPGMTHQEISDRVREGEHKWIEPVRYAGVDVQFFAALIAPVDSRPLQQQLTSPWIERIWPVLLSGATPSTEADITFRMASTPQTLEPAGALTHDFALFVGPKHGALLDPPPFRAEQVLDYGSYFGFIARGMHAVLSFLYGIGLPYWLAIISLTVMVRCCLFPLSRKQAISAARMKELQPKINELKQKYGEDKEKMAKAQMELWRKHNINPLGGCLPLFFQLPVFIGLYTCLNTAVDLRLSQFLWIDNLAAPDALFRMPFALPILGNDFNLLPCINVVLFLIQQKLFMPPPTDEQQELQQKMMNVMTIFFAVMFWHVPAGLCIYFVASSLWSIGERKLLGSDALKKPAQADSSDDTGLSAPSGPAGRSATKRAKKRTTQPAKNDADRPKGILERLMAAAEEARQRAEQDRQKGNSRKRAKQDRKR